jgi:Zn-dependent alcohol dehydrogenases
MKNEFMNVPIFTGEGKVHFEERKIPTPGDNQLLIQAKANLLCGSDRNQFYNGSPQCIPGHEGAGVIVDKGKNAKFDIGMKGEVYLYDYCHKCRRKGLGLTNQCLHKNCDYGLT